MRRFGWALCALLLALAGCQSTDNGAALSASPANPQIFRLGGDTYTVADFRQRLRQDIGDGIAQALAEGQTREAIEQLVSERDLRKTIFDRMIQDALLIQQARRGGIGVDPATVDAAVLAQDAPFDPAAPFADTAALRLGQAQSQLAMAVIARNTRADMFHARHIVLPDAAAADRALSDLAAGVGFARLAEERSQDAASAPEGGDLGWVPAGDLPAAFDAAALSMPLNTPTKVQVGDLWHVVEVLERQAGDSPEQKRPFDSFAQLQGSQNAQQFYESTFAPWYDQLLKDAQASGELVLAPGFDPNSVPLPFPAGP